MIKQDNRISFKIKFDCKCGNCKPRNFIIRRGKEVQDIELLCVVCERLYNINIVSQELE